MNYEKWLSARITELRLSKGVSARDMSLTLGQSESYINKIENGNAMPSMGGFFYICDYFGITPMEFFQIEVENPPLMKEIVAELKKLDSAKAEHILQILKDMNDT